MACTPAFRGETSRAVHPQLRAHEDDKIPPLPGRGREGGRTRDKLARERVVPSDADLQIADEDCRLCQRVSHLRGLIVVVRTWTQLVAIWRSASGVKT